MKPILRVSLFFQCEALTGFEKYISGQPLRWRSLAVIRKYGIQINLRLKLRFKVAEHLEEPAFICVTVRIYVFIFVL